MRRLKPAAALALTLSLAAVVLAGCGTGTTGGANGPATGTPTMYEFSTQT